jgi:hypothetical protein
VKCEKVDKDLRQNPTDTKSSLNLWAGELKNLNKSSLSLWSGELKKMKVHLAFGQMS